MPANNQKADIAKFVEITGTTERQGLRILRSVDWRLTDALEQYFSSDSNLGTAFVGKLNALFDGLRDDGEDEKDKLLIDSTMSYLTGKLGVNIENAEFLVALEVVQAPMVGEISRKGYVDGWKVTGTGASHAEHKKLIKDRVANLSTDVALLKKVYRYTFIAGRERDQKAMSLEAAKVYWSMLFSAPGIEWNTANHDWLKLYERFLAEKWTRSVNKDMWNMTLEFALKSMGDETLSFWNEDGAWPGVIDDFVAWCRTNGIGKAETMDVDR